MAEYIERGAALKEAKYAAVRGLDPVAFVEDVPVADVEPLVYARWIYYPDCGVTRCSHCGWSIEECWESKRCPECGAKMDGGDGNETD